MRYPFVLQEYFYQAQESAHINRYREILVRSAPQATNISVSTAAIRAESFRNIPLAFDF